MSATAIAQREAPRTPAPAPSGGGPAPVYIVCSPSRRVGKTLLARFLVEYHVADGRRVAAYDLADEGPQLADHLPKRTVTVDISTVRGQMALFDALIAANDIPKIIDVSHRAFGLFFAVAHKIGLFEEARRCGIEPVILFMIDPDPKAIKAYSLLRRSFPGVSLLPVRNLTVARGLRYGDAFPHASTLAVSLEISELPPPLRLAVERPGFSFADCLHQPPAEGFSARAYGELLTWIRRLRFQLREIELCLIYEQILTGLR